MIRILLRFWYRLTKKTPLDFEMVQYWKTKEAVEAKVTTDKHGSLIMQMEGEKYPFPGFPRGHLLFGSLSPLKHQIKNQVFNESWAKLEAGVAHDAIIKDIKSKLFGPIAQLAETVKYDMFPPERLCPAVKELYRAWSYVSPETSSLRDYLMFILQEDDGYRFRVQWLVTWFGWWFKYRPVQRFKYALEMLEHGEVIGDMKERIRLLRRILLLCLEDLHIRDLFEKLCREIDWSKVKLSKGDKYHMRGKWFKVDYGLVEY